MKIFRIAFLFGLTVLLSLKVFSQTNTVTMQTKIKTMKQFSLLVRVPETYNTEKAKLVNPQWEKLMEDWKKSGNYVLSFAFPGESYTVSGAEKTIKKETVLANNLKVVSNVVIQAENMEQALELAKSIPVLLYDGTVEVGEIPKPILQDNMEYDIEHLMKTTGSIGAYTKEADIAFGNLIRKTSFGDFDRVDWQLINFLHSNSKTTKTHIIEFLSFLAHQDEIETRIKKFETKNIIRSEGNDVLLTTAGKEAFEEASAVQKQILDASFKDISKQQYEVCIAVIKKMIENMSPYTQKDNN